MKQRISIEDLNQLTDDQKERLRKWWNPQPGDVWLWPDTKHIDVIPFEDFEKHMLGIVERHLPILSIGQMIELFTNSDEYAVDINHEHGRYFCVNISNRYSYGDSELKEYYTLGFPEVCDALWDAVKQIL